MDRADESSTLPQSLPRSLVAKIFQAMHGNYGSRFLNQWKTGQIVERGDHAGKDAGLINAMAFWGKKLAGFADKPECILRVLNSLPSDPPSLPQFVELCRLAPAREKPAITHKLTAGDHQRIAEAAREVKRAVERMADDKVAHWMRHPRSVMHLQMIFDAQWDPRFKAAVAEMVEQGICTADGELLMRYAGGTWERV